MKELSQYLSENTIQKLRAEIEKGSFAKVTFELAMQFILSNGVLPQSGLPVASFFKLEDWLRNQGQNQSVYFTTTELKNETGRVLTEVQNGRQVFLTRHGRTIAELKRVEEAS